MVVDISGLSNSEKMFMVCLYFARLRSDDPMYKQNRTKYLEIVSEKFAVPYSTVKNNKDRLDAKVNLDGGNNGRSGWHQTPLEKQHKDISRFYEKYKHLTNEELKGLADKIIEDSIPKEELFYIIRMKSPEIINDIYQKQTVFDIEGLNLYSKELHRDQVLFVVYGGSKEVTGLKTGLVGIGKVVQSPFQSDPGKSPFNIRISLELRLPRPISKEEMIDYPYVSEMVGLEEVNTRGLNAIARIETSEAVSLVRAIYDCMTNISDGQLESIFGENFMSKVRMGTRRESKETFIELAEPSVQELYETSQVSFQSVGLSYKKETISCFLVSALSKPFVIFTGLSGSGKTKLSQGFARWITPKLKPKDPFFPGARIVGDRIVYIVRDSDALSVEFLNSDNFDDATRVTLPRDLINEWVEVIHRDFTGGEDKPTARTLREAVALSTKFSTQLNSFETHLKAAAYAVIEANLEEACNYEIIPVGADWTTRDPILGYPDALDPTNYVTTPALDLIIRADRDRNNPYFLILDEMNLSHVERYFADILSAIESGEPIILHSGPTDRNGVPPQIDQLPENLYIIGTVNVDETTY